MDSLNLFEVIPIEYMKGRKVVHLYKKIKVENLSSERIKSLYLNCNFKKLPMVTDLKKYFLITFQPKPPILISKENGRLYSLGGKWNLIETQHQASLVMRVLSFSDFVEDHKRKSVSRRKTSLERS